LRQALVALTCNQKSVILSDYVKKTWLVPSPHTQAEVCSSANASSKAIHCPQQPVPAFLIIV